MTSTPARTLSIVLTAIVIAFHGVYAFHAGGLWRDEANTVALTGIGSLSQLWSHLQYDSFPILWLFIVRTLQILGLTTDHGFRILGCFIGISVVAAVWVNARTMRFGVPLISLVLLGLSPTMMNWGDSMRAYGFGTCLMLLTMALIWRIVRSPSPATVTLATLVAICSVQTLYYNSVALLAIGMAGAAVAARNRQWKRALVVLGIGGMAAASLLPYIPAIQGAREWAMVFTFPEFTFGLFWAKVSGALCAAGPEINWIWVALLIAAVAAGVVAQFRGPRPEAEDRRDVGLFCLILLAIAVPAYFVFLKVLRYPTQEWYYITLMGLVAVPVEGALSALPFHWWRKWGIALVAAAIALISFMPAWRSAHVRQTTMDLIAAQLEERATSGDVIVVAPWYVGISFDRYYKGSVIWMTLPPIEDHKVHRYDLVKEQMTTTNPIEPVLKAMSGALESGHNVWIVGWLSWLQPGQSPPQLAPAPYDPVGWSENAYNIAWSAQAAYALQAMRGATAETVPVIVEQSINRYENPELILVRSRQN